MLAYHRKTRQYALTTDASIGDDDHPGGWGAILSQIDEDGNHLAIGYASRKLTDFEKNYTPFLLEMQGALDSGEWTLCTVSNFRDECSYHEASTISPDQVGINLTSCRTAELVQDDDYDDSCANEDFFQ